MRFLSDILRSRVLPALVAALGVSFIAAGLLTYTTGADADLFPFPSDGIALAPGDSTPPDATDEPAPTEISLPSDSTAPDDSAEPSDSGSPQPSDEPSDQPSDVPSGDLSPAPSDAPSDSLAPGASESAG